MQIDIVLNPLSRLNNEAVCLDKDKYPRTPAGYVRSPPRSSPPAPCGYSLPKKDKSLFVMAVSPGSNRKQGIGVRRMVVPEVRTNPARFHCVRHAATIVLLAGRLVSHTALVRVAGLISLSEHQPPHHCLSHLNPATPPLNLNRTQPTHRPYNQRQRCHTPLTHRMPGIFGLGSCRAITPF